MRKSPVPSIVVSGRSAGGCPMAVMRSPERKTSAGGRALPASTSMIVTLRMTTGAGGAGGSAAAARVVKSAAAAGKSVRTETSWSLGCVSVLAPAHSGFRPPDGPGLARRSAGSGGPAGPQHRSRRLMLVGEFREHDVVLPPARDLQQRLGEPLAPES